MSCQPCGGETVVVVKGELDCLTAPDLETELLRLLASSPRRVTVDLQRTTFIDASGLGALIAVLRSARADGAEITLRSPSRCVRKVLEISGADRLFQLT